MGSGSLFILKTSLHLPSLGKPGPPRLAAAAAADGERRCLSVFSGSFSRLSPVP